MKYDFDKIIDRRNTNCEKYDSLKRAYPLSDENTIPLWVADMDFPCSDAIIESIKERLLNPVLGYTFVYADDEYKSAVCDWMRDKHDFIIDKKDIYYSGGIVPAMCVLINSLTNEGDNIIANQPVYTPFMNIVKDNNRNLVNSPLVKDENGDYTLDFEDFEKKIKDNNVKMFLFCSPHNPIGKVWRKDELLKIGEICKKYNVIVFSDEIHCDIVRKGIKHIPIASLFENDDIFITGTAPSKTFNIPGMKVSNIIIKNEEYKNKWKLYTQKRLHTADPNVFVPGLVKAAYKESDDWYNYMLEYVEENFKYIKKFVNENLENVGFEIPQATFLGWLDMNKYDIDYKELSDLFVTKGGFAIQHGKQFGEEGVGYFRINVATSRKNIEKAMNGMKEVLKDIPVK